MTAAECLMRILRDRDYFGVDGGVTLSGGEPMMQAEFCIELASLAKKAGIKVALETSGFCDTAKLIAIILGTDCFFRKLNIFFIVSLFLTFFFDYITYL